MFLCHNCLYIPKFKLQILSNNDNMIIQTKCLCGNIPVRLNNFFDNYFIDFSKPKCSLIKKHNLNSKNKGKYLCYLCKKIYCEKCGETHSNISKHPIKLFSEIQNKCLRHSKELIGYCSNCRVNFCNECHNHKNHKVKLNPIKVFYDDNTRETLKNIDKEIQKIDDNDNINVKIFCFIKMLYKGYISDNSKYYYQIRKNFLSNSNIIFSGGEIIFIEKPKSDKLVSKKNIIIKKSLLNIKKNTTYILPLNSLKLCAGFKDGKIKIIFLKNKKCKTIKISDYPIKKMIKYNNNSDFVLINSGNTIIKLLNLKNYSIEDVTFNHNLIINNIFIQLKNNDLILGNEYEIFIYRKEENLNLIKKFSFEDKEDNHSESLILEMNDLIIIYINNLVYELNVTNYNLKKIKEWKFNEKIYINKLNNNNFIIYSTSFIHIIKISNYQIITSFSFIDSISSVLIKNSYIFISLSNKDCYIYDKNIYYQISVEKTKFDNLINFFDNQIISYDFYSSDYIIYLVE